ncbi:MAG TPA: MaoC family dehydratase [Solirubrobacteraceae bacterium]|nr:MaoC family dehydratase [Solirubrobacteraceae bacterium]
MLTLSGVEQVKEQVGQELGVSEWLEISQERVDQFADATGDHQFIHVDVEKAKQTPFGGTIAHGFLTLALYPGLMADVVSYEGFAFALNYGLNRVRFPAPMPTGKRVRAQARLMAAEDINGGIQVTTEYTFECEGAEKPVCVAEALVRFYT